MNFLEIYRPPFHAEGVCIYTANNIMAFMATNLGRFPKQMMQRTVEILNGDSEPVGNPDVGWDNGEIYINGDPFMAVRGWGYLTGANGLNLSENEATEIQNNLVEWTASKIKGRPKQNTE